MLFVFVLNSFEAINMTLYKDRNNRWNKVILVKLINPFSYLVAIFVIKFPLSAAYLVST